jgi:hypothetical protein
VADKTDDVVSWRLPYGSVDYLDWFDGGTWRLTPGQDFTTQLASFRTYLYRKAQEHGYRLRTKVAGGYLYVQALASDGSELGQLDQYGQPITPDQV